MSEPLINEWLSDWALLDSAELHSFAAEHDQNHEVEQTIYAVLEDRIRYSQFIEPICTQLFGFYRSREENLQRFALQFVPTLIHIYLNAVANCDKKSHKSIETLLIGLYNLEVMDDSGKSKVVSFRLPSLAQASIYHEPLALAPAFLTESSLRRWEDCNTKLVNWGPLPQIEALNAQNRVKIMTALLFVFNRQLSLLSKSALRQLCVIASRLVTQGFHNISSRSTGTGTPQMDHRSIHGLPPRIPVTSQFLLELVHGAYFAMFNEFYTLAFQAINDIAARACYEGYPDVLLVTGAITNSLQANPSGQPCDGPMGISVALSPATTTVTMSKSMITNASFRTKKLPDDIPIQAGAIHASEAVDSLNSITEETEAEINTNRSSSIRSSKTKLSSFPGLGKKGKDKELKGTSAKINAIQLENIKKNQPKDIKIINRNSMIMSANGENGDYQSPMMQKKNLNDISLDVNTSIISEEKVSMVSDSLQNSVDSSDSHSQVTTDSFDMENTTSRLNSMQVSSV